MSEDPNLNHIKINISQILNDCKIFKQNINPPHTLNRRSQRIKTMPNSNSKLSQSFDFDSCVKNIHTKVRSLWTDNQSHSPNNRLKLSKRISSFQLQHKQYSQQVFQNDHKQKISSRKYIESQFPRLLAKFQKAYSPRNASSSQKFSNLDKKQKRSKDQVGVDQFQSYHTILCERKKNQQLNRMFVIGRILRENVIRQKKILQQRKKQRRFQNLQLRQIAIMKSNVSVK